MLRALFVTPEWMCASVHACIQLSYIHIYIHTSSYLTSLPSKQKAGWQVDKEAIGLSRVHMFVYVNVEIVQLETYSRLA